MSADRSTGPPPPPEHAVQAGELFKVETAGVAVIGPDHRHTRPWELGAMWSGAFMNYASLLTGSLLLTFGLGILDSLTAILVGAVLAALVLGLVSVSGARSGVPQIVFSRSVFGYRGAYLAGALTLFLAVGWFAVDCVVATNALTDVLRQAGVGSSRAAQAVLLLLVVAISVTVAIYGHRTVVVFERYGAAVFLVFCGVLFVLLEPKIHWNLGATVHGSSRVGAWILGASVTFALVASWFSFAADYSRYVPQRSTTRSIVGWVMAGAAIPTIVLGSLGVLLFGIDIGTGDLLTTIVQNSPKGPAIAFLLFVALGMIWANYLDVYTAGLVALAMDVRASRWQMAVMAGIVGGALAYYALFVSSFYTAYQNFLLITYIWAPAWAAVVLLDLFVFQSQKYESGVFFQPTGVSWPAVVALLGGTASAVPFVNSSLWTSPLASHLLGGADISGFVSFAVGAALFAGLHRRESEPHS